jgi:hypothetical protein
MYGRKSRRQVSAVGLDPALHGRIGVEGAVSLDALAVWVSARVKEA